MGTAKRKRKATQAPTVDPLFRSPPKKRGRKSAAQLKAIRSVARKPYNVATMREALALVEAGKLNVPEAAETYKRYGVKRSTLYDMIAGKSRPSRPLGQPGKVSVSRRSTSSCSPACGMGQQLQPSAPRPSAPPGSCLSTRSCC
jgi:hypothetical protein